MPPRPRQPLSSWRLLRTFMDNSVAVCDEELFEELFVERRYPWGRVFAVSEPEAVRYILQDNPLNYERIRQIRRAFVFTSGGGMNFLEGEEWWRHRRTINPTFDHRALQPDVPALIKVTEQMVDHFAALPPAEPFEIGWMMVHLVTRTTGHVFAGDDRRIDALLLRMGRFPENYGAFDLVPLPRRLLFLDRLRRSRKGLQECYALLDELIAARRRDDYRGGNDLIWRMANARDRQTGESLTLAELRDELLTLAAGSQAPVRTMSWAFYLLSQFPAAEARLHAELDAVLGSRSLTPDDLPRLTYLRRLVDETMRLYPPLPVMLRIAVADDTVCGRQIPRGSYVAIMPWVIHRHRKLWDDPDRFDPDRFLPERSASRSRYAFIPYSLGPRVCVAAALGSFEILIAMAVLARRVRFRLVPGQRIEPTAWSTLRTKRGIWMTVEPRAGVQ